MGTNYVNSFKNGFEFVLRPMDDETVLRLERKNGRHCKCAFGERVCSTRCSHFVVENCSIVDKKCSLILTCGKHMMRIVEIL